jgi:hypothetical protein
VVDDHDLRRHLRHPSAGLVDLGPQRGLVEVLRTLREVVLDLGGCPAGPGPIAAGAIGIPPVTDGVLATRCPEAAHSR